MRILIVEDDPSVREMLVEFVRREIPGAEICRAGNLDDAVEAIHAEQIDAILSDGTFPSWPQNQMADQWNAPRPNWIQLGGWADKLHIPMVVLSGDALIAAHATKVGLRAFLKPQQVHAAIECLCEVLRPKSVRENPAVEEADLANRLPLRSARAEDPMEEVEQEDETPHPSRTVGTPSLQGEGKVGQVEER